MSSRLPSVNGRSTDIENSGGRVPWPLCVQTTCKHWTLLQSLLDTGVPEFAVERCSLSSLGLQMLRKKINLFIREVLPRVDVSRETFAPITPPYAAKFM